MHVRASWSVVAIALASPVHAAPAGLAYQLTHSITADPSFARDGKQMVYLAVIAGREQLLVSALDGSKPVQITHDDWDHEDPTWAPDGKRIAFVSKQGGLEVITLIDPDGGHVEAVTPPTVRAIHPHYSPDGGKLAYCSDDDVRPPKKNASEIYALDLASRKIVKLIGGGVNTYPTWSPDGKQLAFRRMVGELDSEVFVANADGTNARNLTRNPAFDGWPAWSPDGTRIAFASNRKSSYQIWVMKADGSDVRRVANTEGRATAPAWTPDGKAIYFPLCRAVDLGYDCEIFAVDAP